MNFRIETTDNEKIRGEKFEIIENLFPAASMTEGIKKTINFADDQKSCEIAIGLAGNVNIDKMNIFLAKYNLKASI